MLRLTIFDRLINTNKRLYKAREKKNSKKRQFCSEVSLIITVVELVQAIILLVCFLSRVCIVCFSFLEQSVNELERTLWHMLFPNVEQKLRV